MTSYAERDSRIRLLRPDEFVGAGSNANRALLEISPSSAYVKVVHADDWLFPDCLTRMVHDPKNAEDVLKVNADAEGRGGDDDYDCVRYAAMHAPLRPAEPTASCGARPQLPRRTF